MDSYRGDAGCVDCYREHCKQQTPFIRVVTPDCNRLPSQHLDRTAFCRYDNTRRSCRLFIAGSFVIGLILVPYAMSAPVRSSHSQQQSSDDSVMPTGRPFWHYPCGGPQDTPEEGSGTGNDAQNMVRRDDEIIDGIRLSAKNALTDAEKFSVIFANDIFGMQVKDLHSRFEIFHLKWLNMTEFVPKDLNENLSDTYLQNNVTLRKVLHPIYVGMQHIAVGLEQVAWDYKREGLPNAVYLRNSTIQLKGILCEVNSAIIDVNEVPEPYVPREIWPLESRIQKNKDESLTSLRDWLILRNYINSLQYIVQVFGYLQSNNGQR